MLYICYESFRTKMTKPTESELEILQILWGHGPLTVRNVNDLLNKQRRVGYTTTLKIMQIMTDKSLLSRDTNHRSHVYLPTIKSEEVQSSILDHILKTVFNGSRSNLVMQALGKHSASNEELEEIRLMIEKIKDKEDGVL